MGNKIQAHAEGRPTQEAAEERDSSAVNEQDGGQFDVDGVSSIDDYETAAEIAMNPAPDMAEGDKKLSAEDEEVSFVDPDDEEEPDPDAEEEEGDDASDESADSGSEDESGDQDDGDGDDDDGEEEEDDDSEAQARDDSDADDKPKRRYRLQSDDLVEQRAFDLKRRNRDLSMRECIERAEKELEVDAQGEPRPNPESEQDDGMPRTVAEAEAEIDRLSDEAKKAYGEDLDFEKGAELQARINKLNRLVGKLQLSEMEQGRNQASARDQAYRDAERKAVELYDFVTDPKHPGIKLMEDINERLRDAGDPLYDDPEKPLRIAQMAARELGIAPKGKTRKQTGVKSPGKAPRGKPTVQPVSGNARTNPKTNAGQLDEAVESINSPDDWDRMIYGT